MKLNWFSSDPEASISFVSGLFYLALIVCREKAAGGPGNLLCGDDHKGSLGEE